MTVKRCWQIGGVSIMVQVDAQAFPQDWCDWKVHLQSFPITPEKSDIVILAEPVPLGPWDSGRLRWTSRAMNGVCENEFEAPGIAGIFRQSEGSALRGHFRIDESDGGALENLCLVGIARLLDDEGAILHSSGVYRDGAVWLFSGPSGSGKSTIANELSDPANKFSEDTTILRVKSDNTVWATRAPFGDDRDEIALPESAPVAGIVFIEQAPESSVEEINAMDVVQNLYFNTRYYQRDVRDNQQILKVANEIADTGLCCKMKFRKKSEIWSLLDLWRQKKLRESVGE